MCTLKRHTGGGEDSTDGASADAIANCASSPCTRPCLPTSVGDAHGVLGAVTTDAVDDISDGLPSRVAVGSAQQEQWRSDLHLQPSGVFWVGRYRREAALVAPNV